jgi:hypothetical protein
MLARSTTTRNKGSGNGRTVAENQAYAVLASNSQTRQQKLASAANARAGRRARAAERITAREGTMPAAELERAIDREIAAQMARARAAALTARRKAREAADAADVADRAEREILDATGLVDAGSDGLDDA